MTRREEFILFIRDYPEMCDEIERMLKGGKGDEEAKSTVGECES